MDTFKAYYDIRIVEGLLHESLGDALNSDVGELSRQFIQKLVSYLPYGVRSLPQQTMDSIKDKLMAYRASGLGGINVDALADKPDPDQVQTAVRISGGDPETVSYYLQLFNRQVKSTVKPGTSIDPKVYYGQFRNFMSNPAAGLDTTSLMRRTPAGDPSQAVMAIANSIKKTTSDPQVQAAVDRALKDVLSDTDIRALAWADRRTTAGRNSVSNVLKPYGRTPADLTRELGSDPELRRRVTTAKRQASTFRRNSPQSNAM